MKRVLIIQARLEQYRLRLFTLLQDRLRSDVQLHLVYGKRSPAAKNVDCETSPDWTVQLRSCEIGRFIWFPHIPEVRGADLVIAAQESRLITNYWLFARRLWTNQRLAFWGHGRNFQSRNPTGMRERWKRYWLRKPDWWFAYTDSTRRVLVEQGYPLRRITVLNNAIDTHGLAGWAEAIGERELDSLRMHLGIATRNLAVFCGSFHVHKRIRFLIDAAARIRSTMSDFELLIMGSGPDQPVVEAAASRHRWLHYVGPKQGREKALHMKLGRVFMMPAGVGLAILDAFALQLPLVTTQSGNHGPEICYLRSGENGLMTSDNLTDYSSAVVNLLQDSGRLERLRRHCLAAAKRYSVENMARNFAEGITSALSGMGQ